MGLERYDATLGVFVGPMLLLLLGALVTVVASTKAPVARVGNGMTLGAAVAAVAACAAYIGVRPSVTNCYAAICWMHLTFAGLHSVALAKGARPGRHLHARIPPRGQQRSGGLPQGRPAGNA